MHKENQEHKQIIPLSIVLLSNTKEAKRKQLIKENPKSEATNGFNLTLCHHYRFKHIRYDVNQQWFPPRQWLLVSLYEDPLEQAILSSPVDTPVPSHKTCSLHKTIYSMLLPASFLPHHLRVYILFSFVPPFTIIIILGETYLSPLSFPFLQISNPRTGILKFPLNKTL